MAGLGVLKRKVDVAKPGSPASRAWSALQELRRKKTQDARTAAALIETCLKNERLPCLQLGCIASVRALADNPLIAAKVRRLLKHKAIQVGLDLLDEHASSRCRQALGEEKAVKFTSRVPVPAPGQQQQRQHPRPEKAKRILI